MSNLIIEKLLAKTRRTDLPEFRPGDTVRVHVKIKEGDKERLQAFEGELHRAQNQLWSGRGAHLPHPFQSDRQSRLAALLQSSPRQALLPARSQRQSRPPARRGKSGVVRSSGFGLQPSGFSYRGWETKLVWSGPACLQYHKVSGQECPLHTSRSLKAEARSRS
jgi:hypothetical protein